MNTTIFLLLLISVPITGTGTCSAHIAIENRASATTAAGRCCLHLLPLRGGSSAPPPPAAAFGNSADDGWAAAGDSAAPGPMCQLTVLDRQGRVVHDRAIDSWADAEAAESVGDGARLPGGWEDADPTEAEAAEAWAALRAEARNPAAAALWINITLAEYRRAAAAAGGVPHGDR